jgi:hypothetical protein
VRGRANKQRVANTRRHALVAVLVFELVLVLVDVLVDVEVREADRVLVRVLLLVLVALLVRVAVPVLVAVGVGSTNTKVDPNKAGFCSAMVLSSNSRFNCKRASAVRLMRWYEISDGLGGGGGALGISVSMQV